MLQQSTLGKSAKVVTISTKNQEKYFDKLAVPTNGKIDLVNTKDILFLKSDSNYTEIHLVGGKVLTTSNTLKRYEDKLDPSEFIRIHKSYIIRWDQIASFSPKDNKVKLTDLSTVLVSRGKKEELMSFFKRIMVSLLFMVSFFSAGAQLNTWELGAPSDYFARFVIEGSTDANCDCTASATDRIVVFSNNISSPEFIETRPHENGTYGTTVEFAIGSESSVTRQGQVAVLGAANNDPIFGPCTFLCGDSNGGNSLTYTTDLTYNVSNIEHTWNMDGSVTLDWTVETDIPESTYQLIVNFDIETTSNEIFISDKSKVSHTFDCPDGEEAIVRFNTSNNGFVSNFIDYMVPARPVAPGVLNGSVVTQSCAGVDEILIIATLVNAEDLTNGDCWDSIYTTTTLGSNGTYSLDSLYIGVGNEIAEYKVQAFSEDKEFRILQSQSSVCVASQDSIFTASLTNQGNQTAQSNVDFVDITSYVISGTVTSAATTCGLQGVTIREEIGGNSGISPVETSADGSFNLVVPSGDTNYEIYAQYRFGSGAIMDSVITVAVSSADVSNINFIHTATDTLKGFIGAGCSEFIGEATLAVKSPEGCLITTITTNAAGYYEEILPSRPLTLEVTNIQLDPASGLDLGEVLSGFGSDVYIEFEVTTTVDFVYRRPLTVTYTGLPALTCPAVPHPIVQQRRNYILSFSVKEGETCPTDTGKVMIFDNVSTTGIGGQIVDSIPISNGVAFYQLTPGDPNFFGDYTKSITFQAQVGQEMIQLADTLVVTGAVQSGNNFTTAAPTELPFLILRDPPGDQSYSEFIEENVTSISQTFSTEVGGGVKVWAEASVGTDIFGLEIWGQIGASFEVNSSQSTEEEFVLELTNSQTFRTSDNENIVGEEGDVFVGAAVNFIYASAQKLEFDINTCGFAVDTTLMLNADGFETTFIYTEDWIRNNVIPTRQAIADNSSLPDSVRYRAGNDVNLWEQVLQLNEELKEEALANQANNVSFNSGTGAIEGSKTISKSASKTLEFTTQINIEVAAEAGFEFMNNGVTAGVDVNFQTTVGEEKSQSNTTTTTSTYVLNDGESSDNSFTVNIADDPVYGTPVFKLLGGQTSCPYEEGTQRLDDMSVVVGQPIQDVPTGNEAFFFFDIVSNSFDPNPRSYFLAFNSSTAGGVDVTYAGSGFANPILVPNIGQGINSISTPIKVTKPNGLNQYDFEGLEFFLFPACEDTDNYTQADLAVPFTISAYFNSPCSNVDMLAPTEDWLITSSNNNEMIVTMAGYDLSSDFDQIELQYKKEGGNWLNSGLIRTKLQLNTGSTDVPWDVSTLDDGNYELRLLLTCGAVKSFSDRVGGLMDREAPRVYGIERPANDRYLPGKEISVSFDEEINAQNFNSIGFYLKSIPQNESVPIVIVRDSNKIVINLIEEIGGMYNQAFEVGLIDVSDVYNNQQSDTVKWEFVVSEPDSDDDGNPDTKDFCNGGNDFIDSDLDGLPDDCDCLPNDPINGRAQTKGSLDFDGLEYITVANQDELVPTTLNEVTYETWIYPTVDDFSNTDIIVDIPGNLYLTRQTNNLQLFTSTFAAPQIVLDINEWTHFAFVFKTDSLIVHQNGQPIYANAFTHKTTNSGNPITIGGNQEALYNMDGRMEEIRIWDHARTQEQINYYMNDELSGDETGLSLYFNMNDGIPSGNNTNIQQLTDRSPNFNDGELVAFVKNGGTSNWVVDSPFDFQLTYSLCDSICPDSTMAALDFAPDQIGLVGALQLNSSSGFTPTSTNAVTFELWIKPDSISASGDSARIINQFYGNPISPNYEIFLTSDNKVKARLQGSTNLISNTDIVWNEWTHLAFVFDLTETRLYVNGDFDSSQTSTFPSAGNFFYNPLIGQGGFIFVNDFPFYIGVMDEIRFWSEARTALEIKTNYQTMVDPSTSGLEVYYTFNEGIPGGNNLFLSANNGQTVDIPDATGNGNNAIIGNFSLVGESSNYVQSPIILKDTDKDGIPDFCDECIAKEKLLLQNLTLTSVPYRATQEIILGENLTLPISPMIELRAPKVRSISLLQFLDGAMTIDPSPCEND